MNRNVFVHAGAAVALALAAGAAFASGSDGGGAAETGDAALYNAGKGVYAQRMACSGCPMDGKTLDAAAARGLIGSKPMAALSPDEADALMVYLKRRFKL